MPSGATYEDHEGPVIIYRRGGGAKGAVDIDHMVFRKLGEGVARKRQRILGVITWFLEKWGGGRVQRGGDYMV